MLSNPTVAILRNVPVSDFWNLPPVKVFETELTSSGMEPIEFQWPPASLPNSTYYIALYFADGRNSSSRVFNISINGITYYHNLSVTSDGVAVFATQWLLGGLTNIILTPAAGSDIGPLINAGEVFNLLRLGGRTLTRDGMVTNNLHLSLGQQTWCHFLDDLSAFSEDPLAARWATSLG